MIRKIWDYIGLGKNESPVRRERYESANGSMAKAYLKYLEDLKATQDARQQTIESKNSQIIGQSSIVISIVSLFVPMLATQLNSLFLVYKILLIIVFLTLTGFFILSLHHALKTLQVDKTRYMEGSTTTITKDSRATTEEAFVDEQIKDLVLIINYNNSVTNLSASNLVFASRNFRIGIFTFVIFIVILLLSFLSLKDSPTQVSVTNFKELVQAQKPSQKHTLPAIKKSTRPISHPDTATKKQSLGLYKASKDTCE